MSPVASPPVPQPLLRREAPTLATAAVLVLALAGSGGWLAHRWVIAAPHRAEQAEIRAQAQAIRDAEYAARNPAPVAVPDAVPAPGKSPQDMTTEELLALANGFRPAPVDEIEVVAPRPRRASAMVEPTWIDRPTYSLPTSVMPAGASSVRIVLDCALPTSGQLQDCRARQTPPGSAAAEHIRAQAVGGRMTPLMVDGRPEATRMTFTLTFNRPAALPTLPAAPPRRQPEFVEPAPHNTVAPIPVPPPSRQTDNALPSAEAVAQLTNMGKPSD